MPVFIELNVVLQLKVLVPKLMMLFNESDTKFNTDKLDPWGLVEDKITPPMVAVVDVDGYLALNIEIPAHLMWQD